MKDRYETYECPTCGDRAMKDMMSITTAIHDVSFMIKPRKSSKVCVEDHRHDDSEKDVLILHFHHPRAIYTETSRP